MRTEDMEDWDARFWAPSRGLCESCMPPGLAEELRRIRRILESYPGPKGPTGQTGNTGCVQCGGSR